MLFSLIVSMFESVMFKIVSQYDLDILSHEDDVIDMIIRDIMLIYLKILLICDYKNTAFIWCFKKKFFFFSKKLA